MTFPLPAPSYLRPVQLQQIIAAVDRLTVKARIGVGLTRPAPDVTRAVAGAVRQYLGPRPCTVEITVVQIGG